MTPISDSPFDRVSAVLEAREWELSAAELHGSLCGILSARGQPRSGAEPGCSWLDTVLDQPASGGLAEHERRLFDQLGSMAQQQLEEGECAFHPLLPGDDRDLADRVVALGQWCDGFVGGLGLGGLRTTDALSGMGREAIEDLARIARTELSLDEDSEGDESAFAEVLEFVRIGAVLVYEELRAGTLARHRDLHVSHRTH